MRVMEILGIVVIFFFGVFWLMKVLVIEVGMQEEDWVCQGGNEFGFGYVVFEVIVGYVSEEDILFVCLCILQIQLQIRSSEYIVGFQEGNF